MFLSHQLRTRARTMGHEHGFHPWMAFGTLLVVVLLTTRATEGAITTYLDPALYAAASTGNTTYTFPNPPPSGNLSSYTLGGLTYTPSANRQMRFFNDGTYGNGVPFLAVLGPPNTSGSMNVSLAGATALSFTVDTYIDTAVVTLSVNGTPVTTFPTTGFDFNPPRPTFIGIVSDAPMNSLSFAFNVSELDTTSFQVGSKSVPEPVAAPLVAATAMLVGRRRRSR